MSYQDTAAPLRIDYDEVTDILTVNGVKYTGLLFRALSFAQPGTWFRVEERSRDGAKVSLRSVSEPVERTFDAIIGLGKA